jgi:hypothetical protein
MGLPVVKKAKRGKRQNRRCHAIFAMLENCKKGEQV